MRTMNCLSPPTIASTVTLLVARRRLRLAMVVGHALFETDMAEIHFVTPEQSARGFFSGSVPRPAGSFTDCTSKVVIDELGIKTAVALDAHFRDFGILVVP